MAYRRKRKATMIRSAGEAIDECGGNAAVAKRLHVKPALVSGWRARGISRNFAVHFYAELVEKRGHRLAPQVFGLDSWDMVLMPDKRGRSLKRVA